MVKIPKGCDQQGRHPEAAECCTELGCDDYVEERATRIFVVVVIVAAAFALALSLAWWFE